MDFANDPHVIVATMLIGLGVKTYEEIHDYLKQNVNDDAMLAGIMAEVDARIARRS